MSIARMRSMLAACAVACVGLGVSAAQPGNDPTPAIVSAPTPSKLIPVKVIQPAAPPGAAGLSGQVDVTFVVLPDGTVGNVQVIGSVPPDIFEEVAVAAVRQWRYAPVIRDGKAV